MHLPHERDLEGGWVETRYAQNADPSLIPSIDGDNIILTDPVTGEQTVIHHVIGPGYEIVRIEGTDGNDIIELVVDGPSITYVDGGTGDDIIEGTDQADILVGGAGDDTITGNEGNDWLHGGQVNNLMGGKATISGGGDQDDIMYGSGEIDHIYGNRGDDIIHGGLGADFLYGGEGNDEIFGNVDDGATSADKDVIEDGAGDDIIHLGNNDLVINKDGSDTFILESGHGASVIRIYRSSGSHDTVIGNGGPTSLTSRIEFMDLSQNELYFQRNGLDLKILVIGEDQSITVQDFFSGQLNLNIHTHGHWSYAANIDNSSISSIDYMASIDAQFTIDEQNYNHVSDSDLAQRETMGWHNAWRPHDNAGLAQLIYYATEGNDSISLGGNALNILCGAGNDTLTTSLPNEYRHEYFFGDSGNDVISGGNGLDTLIGGLGNDILYGETHEDTLLEGMEMTNCLAV